MIGLIEREKSGSAIEQRMNKLKVALQCFREEGVENLSSKTQDWVYLIDVEKIENWPAMRVRLAQANRYYVAYGENMGSGKIVEAMRDGAYDVLDLKDSDERWMRSLEKAEKSQRLWLELYGGSAVVKEGDVLVGESPAIESLQRTIRRVGPTDASVLIMGESGVGKERVARMLHQSGPFVAVNCAAIPKDLMEAELFGASKGAYTGATADRPGLVRDADGGTLFLDEIGEMDLTLQPKLLRFLESHRARPLGKGEEYQANVRIVSATNRDLQKSASQGGFRLDLYYRLAEVTVQVPALRERIKDIPVLAQVFLQAACERFGKNYEVIEPNLIERWQSYPWPGNVRELKHVIEQLVLFYDGPVMRTGWWAPEKAAEVSAAQVLVAEDPGQSFAMRDAAQGTTFLLNRRQKYLLAKHLLDQSGGDYSWVASKLGIHPTTLYRWRVKQKL